MTKTLEKNSKSKKKGKKSPSLSDAIDSVRRRRVDSAGKMKYSIRRYGDLTMFERIAKK